MYEATFPKKALHSIDLIKHFEFSFFFSKTIIFLSNEKMKQREICCEKMPKMHDATMIDDGPKIT